MVPTYLLIFLDSSSQKLLCGLLSTTAQWGNFHFPGNFPGRCIICLLGSNSSCCTLAPERQPSVTQARSACSAIGSVEQVHKELMNSRISWISKGQRIQRTPILQKISVPSECRWISVLPLLSCPRTMLLMQQTHQQPGGQAKQKNRK